MVTNKLHTNKEPWDAISRAVGKSKKQVLVAIAYIGKDAPKYLPLKRGDILVCDASNTAIKNRSTSAAALRKYHRAGVSVFSREGLHSKLVVLPDRVFVGSANASAHSAVQLDETMLETTHRGINSQSRRYILELASDFNALTYSDISKLNEIKLLRQRTLPATQNPPQELPDQVGRLWIMATKSIEWNQSTQTVYESERTETKREALRTFGPAFVDAVEWPTAELRTMKNNDWLIEVEDARKVHSPAQILRVSNISRSRMSLVWFARSGTNIKHIKFAEFANIYNPANDLDRELWSVRGAPTRERLLRLFQ